MLFPSLTGETACIARDGPLDDATEIHKGHGRVACRRDTPVGEYLAQYDVDRRSQRTAMSYAKDR